jgi:hypothetical protein
MKSQNEYALERDVEVLRAELDNQTKVAISLQITMGKEKDEVERLAAELAEVKREDAYVLDVLKRVLARRDVHGICEGADAVAKLVDGLRGELAAEREGNAKSMAVMVESMCTLMDRAERLRAALVEIRGPVITPDEDGLIEDATCCYCDCSSLDGCDEECPREIAAFALFLTPAQSPLPSKDSLIDYS